MTQTRKTQSSTTSESPLLRALATGSFGDVLKPLVVGAAVLTLALATMGNLGSSALLVGPVLALGLVTARVFIVLANAAAEMIPSSFDDLHRLQVSDRL